MKWIIAHVAYMLLLVMIISGLSASNVKAQEDQGTLYLVFEFMQVDNEQEAAYQETENFWKKIHQQRVADGEIIGWDLWSLQPGGEDQGFQYLTVTLFEDPTKMMGDADIMAATQKAYPNMTQPQLDEKFNETASSRDLAARLYLEQIASTSGDFNMKVGTVASIDLMKVEMNGYEDYEKAEMEIFMPWHQNQVDADNKGSWGLLRVMNPVGTDVYTSHITVNMYSGWDQVFSQGSDYSSTYTEEMAVQSGLQTRDMKWSYFATLRDMVR